MASLAEQLRARESTPEAAPAPEGGINESPAFEPGRMVTSAMLKAAEGGLKSDVGTFKDVLDSIGSGFFNAATFAAGLPASILKWATAGQQAQIRYDRAMRESDPGKAEAIASGTEDAEALDAATKFLPTIENTARWGRQLLGSDPEANFKPATQAGQFAEILTENLALGVPGTLALGKAGARAIAAGTKEAGKGFLGNVGARYAASPLGLAGQEVGQNVAASGGQLLGRNLAEDESASEWGKAAYELGGALIGGFGSELAWAGARGVGRTARQAIAPHVNENSPFIGKLIAGGTEGAQDLAARLIKGTAVIDPEAAVANLRARAEFVPGANAFLLPAWATEDKGLLALAAGSAMAKIKLGVSYSRAEAELNRHVQGYFRSEAGSNIPVPSSAGGNVSQETMQAAAENIKPVFQTIVDNSIAQLDERVNLLRLEVGKAVDDNRRGNLRNISAAAAKPIEDAYRDARAVGNALYAMLPDVQGATTRTRAAMDMIDAEAKQLGNPDIYPAELAKVIKGTNKNLIAAEEASLKAYRKRADELKGMLDSGKPVNWQEIAAVRGMVDASEKRLEDLRGKGGHSLGEIETTSELRAFRSWALELSAQAFKESAGKPPNPRLGKFYSDIADAIDQDIVAAYKATGNADYIRAAEAANAYNRRLNDHFTRGPISEIRGIDARRGNRVAAEEIFDKLLLPGGRGGERNLDALLDAEAFGNDVRSQLMRARPDGVGDRPLTELSEGFMAQHYYESVTRRTLDGGIEVVPEAHLQFMKRYGKMIDAHFPNLSGNLADTGRRMDLLERAAADAKSEAANIRNKDRNILQLWIEADPDRAIAKLRASDAPRADAKKLVEAASRDPTGKALPSLRQVIYEDMLAQVRTEGQRDALDQVLQPGGRMANYLRDNDAMLSVIMTPEQRTAMKNVQRETVAAENRIRTTAVRGFSPSAQQQAIIDAMGKDTTTMSTLIQAAYGGSRAMGAFANSIPFISTLAARSERAVLDNVNEVIYKAIFEDRALMEALLMRPTPKNLPLIRARLRPYFVTAGDADQIDAER